MPGILACVTSETDMGRTKFSEKLVLPSIGDVRDFHYQRTDLGESRVIRDAWLNVRPEKNHYDPTPYKTLENALRRAGQTSEADDVYFTGEVEYERYLGRQMLRGTATLIHGEKGKKEPGIFGRLHTLLTLSGKYILSLVFRLLSGYGIRVWRPVLWFGLCFVGIAAIMNGKVSSSVGFWENMLITLEAIVPGLQIDEKMLRESQLPHSILTLSRLVGLTLLPLIVAQLAGLLKRRSPF